MDFLEDKLSIDRPKKKPGCYRSPVPTHACSSWFEVRLFYVRISPCPIDCAPNHLTLRHLRRATGVVIDINGARFTASDTASLVLRRDRLDKESSEVTYVSTDSVRITGPVDFQVYEREDLILCGTLERLDSTWRGGGGGGGGDGVNHNDQVLINDSKTGWSMDYCSVVSTPGSSAFLQPKIDFMGVSSPSVEVYVAGCCAGFPLILTKTIQISSRKKHARQGTLDSIPEDEETGREQSNNSSVRHRTLQVTEGIMDEYDSEGKIGRSYYPEADTLMMMGSSHGSMLVSELAWGLVWECALGLGSVLVCSCTRTRQQPEHSRGGFSNFSKQPCSVILLSEFEVAKFC